MSDQSERISQSNLDEGQTTISDGLLVQYDGPSIAYLSSHFLSQKLLEYDWPIARRISCRPFSAISIATLFFLVTLLISKCVYLFCLRTVMKRRTIYIKFYTQKPKNLINN